MYQNRLKLTSKRGELLLLGVLPTEPNFTAISYVADHSANAGAIYQAPDADDPSVVIYVVTIKPIHEGWWQFHPDDGYHPFFRLMTPAQFVVLEGTPSGEEKDD
jgi:hypothetical protein